MKYFDMHCDALTACFDGGYALANGDLQVNLHKLGTGGCAAQCFAVFTQGGGSAERVREYLGFYDRCLNEGGIKAVLNYKDLSNCLESGTLGAVLTIENLGFIGSPEQASELHSAGVRMASLVWNYENALAYPNTVYGKDGAPLFSAREKRGLKPMGREVISRLDESGIIVDISHLSDGGAEEILDGRKIPVVASHSDAAAQCAASRNLTDALIKKVADCGGVIGVNFCKKFLGVGDTFELVLRHISHLIKTGGEDCVAFGGDFDGIPAPPSLEDCTRMPALIGYLHSHGICGRMLEKLCTRNFARVFAEVCG